MKIRCPDVGPGSNFEDTRDKLKDNDLKKSWSWAEMNQSLLKLTICQSTICISLMLLWWTTEPHCNKTRPRIRQLLCVFRSVVVVFMVGVITVFTLKNTNLHKDQISTESSCENFKNIDILLPIGVSKIWESAVEQPACWRSCYDINVAAVGFEWNPRSSNRTQCRHRCDVTSRLCCSGRALVRGSHYSLHVSA